LNISTEDSKKDSKKMMSDDEVEEQSFAQAFADVGETCQPDQEATFWARHPELQLEEERLADAQAAEALDDYSRGITYERSGSADGTVTYRTPNANNATRLGNQSEGHLSEFCFVACIL
jgi:hypothetical protein